MLPSVSAGRLSHPAQRTRHASPGRWHERLFSVTHALSAEIRLFFLPGIAQLGEYGTRPRPYVLRAGRTARVSHQPSRVLSVIAGGATAPSVGPRVERKPNAHPTTTYRAKTV